MKQFGSVLALALAASALAFAGCGARITTGGDGGMDGSACGPGQEICDGVCVDTRVSTAHCGSCGSSCAAGEVCSAGSCAASCGTGLTECGGACVDTDTDPAYCGDCTTASSGPSNSPSVPG